MHLHRTSKGECFIRYLVTVAKTNLDSSCWRAREM